MRSNVIMLTLVAVLCRPAGAHAIGTRSISPACAALTRLMCDVEKTVMLYPGSPQMPPLVQVPGGELLLEAIVKPPDADVLGQWEESRGNTDADSSWGSVWPAALNLAAFLTDHSDLVRGQRVAELGSGLAVAGLTAAKLGASTVTLVDREAFALHCAMSTAQVCGLPTGPVPDNADEATAFYDGESSPTSVVSASRADWAALAGTGLEVDVVLASEILYEQLEPSAVTAIACAAATLLSSGGTLLVADPAQGRVGGARTALTEALGRTGAVVSEQPIAAPPAGDAWYSLRAGDGMSSIAGPDEAVVLLRADFAGPPDLDAL